MSTPHRVPSASQAALIAFFDGGPKPSVRVNEVTYRICRDMGWIERIDSYPYHRITEAGRLARTAYLNKQATSTADVDAIMRLVAAYGAECSNNGTTTSIATSLLDQIRQAIVAKP